MQIDLMTLADVTEATTVNNIKFREFTLDILKDNITLHKLTDEDLKKT